METLQIERQLSDTDMSNIHDAANSDSIKPNKDESRVCIIN